jgi:hypothetical protein
MLCDKTGIPRRAIGSVLLTSVALVMMAGVAVPTRAEQPATTLATLLDKQQIQDMLVEYYSHLGPGKSDFGSYYVADGILDVNGLEAQGQKPIEDLYKKIAGGSPNVRGAFRMLLTNLRVVINGETATADTIWTGIRSEKPAAIPEFVEQGREHDELVKRDGHWLFKHRYITSDGGLQPMFEKTYKNR